MKTWLIRFSVLVLTLGLRGLRTAWIGLAGCADAESAYSKPGGASPIIQCRRGDLNPHGTRYRQILSLLRMPISPLRRRLTATVYQKHYQNPLVMSPICRLWRRASLKVLPFRRDGRPGYSASHASVRSGRTASWS